MLENSNVIKKGSIVYLRINKDWFQYDESAAPIGSGAMGIVYMGFHCATHMRVAIKMVRENYADIPAIRQRAKQEAALMFMHRNLIEMLGYCEWQADRGPIWTISKFVQGVNINTFLRSYPRQRGESAQRICQMFLPVLDALHYLHTSPTPIYHLDIKPSNIMIENGSNVRLMDLGISMTTNGLPLGSLGMMGTPNYAAPEQFDNSYGFIDARTDIYEAGVTLYELLADYNPYDSTSVTQTIEMHKELIIPKHDDIPAPIFEVLRKATNPQQDQRYNDVMEFKTALIAAINGTASGTGGLRNTISIVIIAICVMLLLAIAALYLINI